jgi:hypothetical protein
LKLATTNVFYRCTFTDDSVRGNFNTQEVKNILITFIGKLIAV